MRKRRTARVMLFDEAGDVLLIRFVVPREEGEFVFWALPGGEIEAGETEAAAAAREVREETGLELVMSGPVYCDRNQFLHQREMQDNTDFLFRARCRREEPRLMGVTVDEREIMREIRWWSEGEIAGSRERIFPENLAGRMREQNGLK
ncbi:NUDIX domain-containing protein [Tunturiibacter empetritectus]|uniref:ADP-ribose pyrophosphatase YjhB (NUDIX family) n=1 Tax=Tunturiibacter lichenicola TaxID=2051959 RepID=A0A852VL13_9BACT|nr:ADP-ribose pyrophosphatase YjhB (NUDIX family) [Edaphobacter lichenicola]